MKLYRVKVNGKVYEVELEAVSESAAPIETAVPEKKPVSESSGDKTINAPIAGKILEILVKPGDPVKKDQQVAVIEAMKLENELLSPVEGRVKEILVKVGDSVRNKDVLITLE